jgi:hypothetical protein
VTPKSTKPARIAENIDIFDFELSTGKMAAIDSLETGRRSGPEPETSYLSHRPVRMAPDQLNAGGGERNRTAVEGFAGPCLDHSATPPGAFPEVLLYNVT